MLPVQAARIKHHYILPAQHFPNLGPRLCMSLVAFAVTSTGPVSDSGEEHLAHLHASSSLQSRIQRLPSLFLLQSLALQFQLVFAAPNEHCKHAEGGFIFLERTTQHIRREALNSAGSFLL